MIQRKQTLFLLLAVVVMVIGVLYPIAALSSGPGMMKQVEMLYLIGTMSLSDGLTFSPAMIPSLVLTTLSIVLSFVAIFLYRNRPLQSRLCVTAAVLQVLWYIAPAVYIFVLSDHPEITPGIGAVFPLVAFILLLMANAGVRADERLVRAADRLR